MKKPPIRAGRKEENTLKITNRITYQEAESMLDTEEVAARLGIKRSAVYPLCYKPDGLRTYKLGGMLRFKSEDVEEFIRRLDRIEVERQ